MVGWFRFLITSTASWEFKRPQGLSIVAQLDLSPPRVFVLRESRQWLNAGSGNDGVWPEDGRTEPTKSQLLNAGKTFSLALRLEWS